MRDEAPHELHYRGKHLNNLVYVFVSSILIVNMSDGPSIKSKPRLRTEMKVGILI